MKWTELFLKIDMYSVCVISCRQTVHNFQMCCAMCLAVHLVKNQQLQNSFFAEGSRKFLNSVIMKPNENNIFQMLIDLTLPLFVFILLTHWNLLFCFVCLFNKTKLRLLSLPLSEPVNSPHDFSGEANQKLKAFLLQACVNSSPALWVALTEQNPNYWVHKSGLLKTGESVMLYPILPAALCSWFENPHSNCSFKSMYLLLHIILSRKLIIWRGSG